MTFEDVQAIVADLTCDPYTFRVWREWFTGSTQIWWLQVSRERIDADTHCLGIGYGGRYSLAPEMTLGSIIQTALAACLAFAEHEVRESFLYKDERIFGPHPDIDALWQMAQQQRLAR